MCLKISTASIDAVVDAGPTRHGVESTVLDPTQSPMLIYRPGAITAQQIRDVAGPVDYFKEQMLPSVLLASPFPLPERACATMRRARASYLSKAALADLSTQLVERRSPLRKRSSRHHASHGTGPHQIRTTAPWRRRVSMGAAWSAPEELAEKLYAGLRALDAEGCTVILCPVPHTTGVRRSDSRSP